MTIAILTILLVGGALAGAMIFFDKKRIWDSALFQADLISDKKALLWLGILSVILTFVPPNFCLIPVLLIACAFFPPGIVLYAAPFAFSLISIWLGLRQKPSGGLGYICFLLLRFICFC